MSFKILKNENFKILDFLNFSFLEDKKLHPFFTLFSFASFLNKEIVIFYHKNNDNVILIPKELPLAFIDFCQLYFKLNETDLEDSFFMISLAEKMNFNLDEYFKLFEVTGWQYYKKGIYYFKICKEFSPLLKRMVFDKKISFKEAVYFYNTFNGQDYDKILRILPEFFTFSEKEFFLRNIADYARRNKKAVEEIIAILNKSDDLLQACFQLKYPEYSVVLNNFHKFMEFLKIERVGKMKFDRTFEKEEYNFEISFKTLYELKKKVLDIIKNIDAYEKNGGIDYFQHVNLFNIKDQDEK